MSKEEKEGSATIKRFAVIFSANPESRQLCNLEYLLKERDVLAREGVFIEILTRHFEDPLLVSGEVFYNGLEDVNDISNNRVYERIAVLYDNREFYHVSFSEQSLEQVEEVDQKSQLDNQTEVGEGFSIEQSESVVEKEAEIVQVIKVVNSEEAEKSLAYQSVMEQALVSYQEKQIAFASGDYQEELPDMIGSREDFARWKNYTLFINEELPDLIFDFREILEKDEYRIVQEDQVLTMTFSRKDPQESLKKLKELSAQVDQLLETENLTNEALTVLSGVRIRGKIDEDYFIDESGLNEDVCTFLKKSLETILLIYKVLNRKTREQLLILMGWIVKNEKAVLGSLVSFEQKVAPSMLSFIAQPDMIDQQASIESVFDETNAVAQDNYKMVSEAKKVSAAMKKKYVSFLQKSLFRTFNDIRVDRVRFDEQKAEMKLGEEDLNVLNTWGMIYDNFSDLILAFLSKLDIDPLFDERGALYDPDRHNPYTEPEPDSDLKDDQIKEVVNLGFGYKIGNESGESFIMKPIDVILVRNK